MGIFTLSIILVFLLSSTIVYFFFKKRNPASKPLKNMIYWASSMILSPIIYISSIWIWFSIGANYEDKPFDKTEWMNNQHNRYIYTKDIVENDLLKNLSKEDVIELLGKPSEKNDSTFVFQTGYNPKIFMNGRPDFLEIRFADGRAKQCLITR